MILHFFAGSALDVHFDTKCILSVQFTVHIIWPIKINFTHYKVTNFNNENCFVIITENAFPFTPISNESTDIGTLIDISLKYYLKTCIHILYQIMTLPILWLSNPKISDNNQSYTF